jgi:hypothetical protein
VPVAFACQAPFEQRPHLAFDRFDPLLEGGAVAVLLELLPGLENVPGGLEAVQAERFLGSQAEVGVEVKSRRRCDQHTCRLAGSRLL